MKKTISILLAILMIASLASAAFADGENTEVYEDMGITLTYPEEVANVQGVIYPYPFGAINSEPNIYFMPVYYFAMPEDSFRAFMTMDEDDISEEDAAAFRAAQGTLGYVLVSDVDRETAVSAMGAESADNEIIEIGTADGFNFFYVFESDEDYLASIGEEFAADFEFAQAVLVYALENAELYAPVDPLAGIVGKTFHFETTDVYGNPVTSEEIFGANEITMINYWGTWCHFCVEELGELAEIHTRLQEKGCGIIGILQDGDDEECVEKAKTIMMEHGTNYPVLLPTDDMAEILDDVSSFPTSFFVDKSGSILCYPVEGAAVNEYEPTVLSLLEGEAVSRSTAQESIANDLKCYRVYVYDTDGNPVKGVAIQFCSDDACNLVKTDADGVARFDVAEGLEYSVHVFKVPAGYIKNTGEFKTLDVYSDVRITIEKDA